ncbi:MAG: hypothetical protein IPO06_29540 [Leptospiraceae bacterium]|nr:hypothetical protein [Leptospiraceae bacterium]MBP6738347.1 hypothetical protein [Leptospiraceae bacterium]
MSEFVSKTILFSEPESSLFIAPDSSEVVTINKGVLGLSVVRIDKQRREQIKNITFSKISDSSYQKNYDRIEFLDRSTKAEQIEQTGETGIELEIDSDSTGTINGTSQGRSEGTFGYVIPEKPDPLHKTFTAEGNLETTNYVDETDLDTKAKTLGSIKGFMSVARSRTPAKNIFLYNAFNFNYSKQAIETNSICEVYFVREGFLLELLQANTDYTVNGKVYSSQELRDENPGKNYTRRIEDYKIEFLEELVLDKSSFRYVTTLSTADSSNYNYSIDVNPDYDYILFLPLASPKSVSIKKPKLEVFYTRLLENTDASEIPATDEGAFFYPSGFSTPQNVGDYAALYNHLNKNAVEFFVKKYSEFIDKFYNYDIIQDTTADKKFYTLKNIRANINFNLEEKYDGT